MDFMVWWPEEPKPPPHTFPTYSHVVLRKMKKPGKKIKKVIQKVRKVRGTEFAVRKLPKWPTDVIERLKLYEKLLDKESKQKPKNDYLTPKMDSRPWVSLLTPKSEPKKQEIVERTPIDIQAATKKRTNELIGEVDEMFDTYCERWAEVKMYRALFGIGVKPLHAKGIISHAKRNLVEFEGALKGKDEQLVEGYKNFSRVQLKKIVQWWKSIIEDCQQLIKEGRFTRKSNRLRKKRKKEIAFANS